MKKNALLLLLLFSAASFAQIKFGAVAGINNSFFTEGAAKGFSIETSIGLQAGMFAEIDLGHSIHFRPKLMYSQEGDRHQTTTDYSSQEINTLDYKLSYVNVPLDFKFGNRFYVVAGPQVGFAVGKKRQNLFISSLKSTYDIGCNVGVGLKLRQFFAEIGAYQGFITVFRYYHGSTGNIVDAKNGSARLAIGYYFN